MVQLCYRKTTISYRFSFPLHILSYVVFPQFLNGSLFTVYIIIAMHVETCCILWLFFLLIQHFFFLVIIPVWFFFFVFVCVPILIVLPKFSKCTLKSILPFFFPQKKKKVTGNCNRSNVTGNLSVLFFICLFVCFLGKPSIVDPSVLLLQSGKVVF